jgi:hypothetical protein
MAGLRGAIAVGALEDFVKTFHDSREQGDIEQL